MFNEVITPNEIEENKTQLQLFNYIELNNSFIFNAGAGAGKTYALIESLKHLLKSKLSILQKNNQQIACITYTNIAVKEIKERLGHSDSVVISTIHEMLWDIIKIHQPQLLYCHYEKLTNELNLINNELLDESLDKLKVYTTLNESQKLRFSEFAFASQKTYYQNINAKSSQFRAAYDIYKTEYGESNIKAWLKNFSNFKVIIKKLYKQRRYLHCKLNIERRVPEYQTVEYDSTANSDRLDKMKFSHDTLLTFASTLIKKYPTLRRIIIDKYPYFFIDEYQDTSEEVIKIFHEVHKYSEAQNKTWLLGYFGDALQNIYDIGVGHNISKIHPNLLNLNKKFNRRSHVQIIETINKIRNDNINQEYIFKEKSFGKVEFFHADTNGDEGLQIKYTEAFLREYQDQLSSDDYLDKPKIDCLVLTNKLMAKLNGFGDIYDAFNKAENIYYQDLNTKLLSHELEKLDPTIRLLYRFIRLFMRIKDNDSTYFDIFGAQGKKLSFLSASTLLDELKSIQASTLGELIKNISARYNDTKRSGALDIYVNNFIKGKSEELKNYPSIDYMVKSLLRDLMIIGSAPQNDLSEDQRDVRSDIQVEQVELLLKIPLTSWYLWVNYIDQKVTSDFTFHTYHGTKGEEYENVAIIMGHSFGGAYIGKNKFKKYFEHLQLDSNIQQKYLEDDLYKTEFQNTLNLVYVACSRAVKNIKVLYLDDINDIEQGIGSIFENCKPWKVMD